MPARRAAKHAQAPQTEGISTCQLSALASPQTHPCIDSKLDAISNHVRDLEAHQQVALERFSHSLLLARIFAGLRPRPPCGESIV